MRRRELPAPTILVDGEPLHGAGTEIGHLGGYDLTIITTIGPLAIDVCTTVTGHPDTPTAVAHMIRAQAYADAHTELLAPGGLNSRNGRGARLLDHYRQVQIAVEHVTGADVRIQISDHALDAALP